MRNSSECIVFHATQINFWKIISTKRNHFISLFRILSRSSNFAYNWFLFKMLIIEETIADYRRDEDSINNKTIRKMYRIKITASKRNACDNFLLNWSTSKETNTMSENKISTHFEWLFCINRSNLFCLLI